MAGGGLEASLLGLGINVKPEFLRQCISHLRTSTGPTAGRPPEEQDLMIQVYTTILNTDLRVCAGSILPAGINQMADQRLPGPYVVEVIDSKNIGEPLETRKQQTSKRCMRLALTDGQQCVSGFEYRTIDGMSVSTPVGTKMILKNICVRDGILLLQKDTAMVLGGSMPDDEGAPAEAIVMATARAPPPPGPAARVSARPPPPPPPPPSLPPPARPPPQQSSTGGRFRLEDDGIDWANLTLPTPLNEPPPARTDPLSPPGSVRSKQAPSARHSSPHQHDDEVIVIDDDSPPLSATGSSIGSPQPQRTIVKPSGRLHPPFVSLADLGDYRGASVVIKAVAVGVEKAKVTKKGLRIFMVLDDGTETITARLGDAVLQELLGISSADFRELRDTDPQASARLLSEGQRKLSTLEGVMEIKLPMTQPGASKGDEDKRGGGVPVVISRRQPSLEDLRQMVRLYGPEGSEVAPI